MIQAIAKRNKVHYTRAPGESRHPPRQIRSGYGVIIWIQDPNSWSGWLPNFSGDFLVRTYIYDKNISPRSDHFSRDTSQIV